MAGVRGGWALRCGVLVVLSVTVAGFAVLARTITKGFDWTDEGFGYVMLTSNYLPSADFLGFQLLLHPLWTALGGSALAWRILRLVGYVVVGLALTALAKRTLASIGVRLGRLELLLVALAAQGGTFLAWSYPPRYLGYNELSAWLVQLACGLLVLLVVSGRAPGAEGRRRWTWLLWGLLGAAGGLLVLVKITAAVALALVALGCALVPQRTTRWWHRISGLIGGGLAAGLLMLAGGVPVAGYLSAVLGAVGGDANVGESYQLETLTATYLGSVGATVAQALPFLALLAIAVVGGVVTRVPGPSRPVVAALRGVALLAAVGFVVWWEVRQLGVSPWGAKWLSLGVVHFVSGALALGIGAVVLRVARDRLRLTRQHWVTVVVVALVFVATPFVASAGTNNPIMAQGTYSGGLWAMGATLALVLLHRAVPTVWVSALAAVVAVGLAAGYATGVWTDARVGSYRTARYAQQDTPAPAGPLSGLRLTSVEVEAFAWLTRTDDALGADGDPAVALSSPGALLAFNASGWTYPWPSEGWARSIELACESKGASGLYVIQAADWGPGVPRYDRFVRGMELCGYSFPGDFRVVAERPHESAPWSFTVWQLEN